MAAFQTIFSSDLGQTLLLFVLIFTIIFAILQKSKVLGGGKQIDALVALSIGLIVSGVGFVLEFTQKILPVMAIIIVISLVFLILTAMFFKGEVEFGKFKWAFAVLAGLIVIIATIVFTGYWDNIKGWFSDGGMASNLLLIIIVIAVVAFIYSSTKGSSSGSHS